MMSWPSSPTVRHGSTERTLSVARKLKSVSCSQVFIDDAKRFSSLYRTASRSEEHCMPAFRSTMASGSQDSSRSFREIPAWKNRATTLDRHAPRAVPLQGWSYGRSRREENLGRWLKEIIVESNVAVKLMKQ